jgi:hypothetical protein
MTTNSKAMNLNINAADETTQLKAKAHETALTQIRKAVDAEKSAVLHRPLLSSADDEIGTCLQSFVAGASDFAYRDGRCTR